MPHYTFKRGERVKIFKTTVEGYDRLFKLLTFWGWERVIDPPASVHVRGTMSEYYNEAIDHAAKLTRENGWSGLADNVSD